jgi:hypothetical protein
MKKRELEFLRSPAALTAAKATVLGFIAGELMLVTYHLLSAMTYRFQDKTIQLLLIVEATAVVLLLANVAFRYWPRLVCKFALSGRVDLAATFLFGLTVALLFPIPEYVPFNGYLLLLTDIQLVALFGLLIIIPAVHTLRSIILGHTSATQRAPIFLNDDELTSPREDLLGLRELSERFAQQVLNGGSPNSIVFGLDAPWGTGKSSFVNFCVTHLTKSIDVRATVFHFNPLHYEDRKHLLQKFIDGLVLKIRETHFIPELQTIVSRYSNLVSQNQNISIGGFELGINRPSLTIDQAAEDIRFALSTIRHRLVIIVDDLDRIEFSEIKDILFAIKKGFALPNASFILCYDSERIGALEADAPASEKISEFLEKFVNVKVGLFVSTADLERYLTAYLDAAARENPSVDFHFLDDALSGLRSIYKSANYHQYAPFVGDVRKIKRLINTLVLLKLDQIDFKISDYDTNDLIHLLLIYINYPVLFRQIYDAETDGRSAVFSTVHNHSSNRSTFANSKDYIDFDAMLKAEGRKNELFLLSKLFNVNTRLKHADTSSVTDSELHTYACFNLPSQRNLEGYLNLIVRISNPPNRSHYNFYVDAMSRFAAGQPLEEIFKGSEFGYNNNEMSYKIFWRVIVNNVSKLNATSATKAIDHLVENLDKHSRLEDEELGLGLRYSTQQYTILKILDAVGWRDHLGTQRDNSDQNVYEIADWIFGTGPHADSGILPRLMAPARGVLGFGDALIFRLYCCIDRSTTLFNLHRALIKRSDPNAPTTGATTHLVVPEMREMSQSIFATFKKAYIEPERNLFADLDGLNLEDLTGQFILHVQDSIESGKVKQQRVLDQSLAAKNAAKSFIVYQLTNKLIRSGIGCGYYDETGRQDAAGISREMNAYIFRCFGADADAKGFEYFLDYMLTQFRSSFGTSGDRAYYFDLKSIAVVLDLQSLRDYWATYRVAFDALKFELQDKKIVTPNYVATYRDDLPSLYAALDRLLLDGADSPGDLNQELIN